MKQEQPKMIDSGFWTLVSLTIFPMTGEVNSQAVEFSCEISSLCLNQPTTYVCTVQDNVVEWTIRDSNGTTLEVVTQTNSNTEEETTGFDFAVTSNTTSPVTSTVSFITLSVYDGYTVFCSVPGVDSRNCSLSISDIPSEPLHLMVSFEVSLTHLMWNSPFTSSACVTNYTITTNASTLMSTTGINVMIEKPAGDPENSTYTVSVAAVDSGGRVGPPASIDCFMFGGPRPVILETNPLYLSMEICMSNTISALITWKPFDCLPVTISYNVTHNITGLLSEVTVTENNFTLENLSLGNVYQVEIVAINALGSSLPTSTLISIPSNCPTTKPSITMSTSPIEVSNMNLPQIIGLVVGVVVAFVIFSITIVTIAVVLLKLKREPNRDPRISPSHETSLDARKVPEDGHGSAQQKQVHEGSENHPVGEHASGQSESTDSNDHDK